MPPKKRGEPLGYMGKGGLEPECCFWTLIAYSSCTSLHPVVQVKRVTLHLHMVSSVLPAGGHLETMLRHKNTCPHSYQHLAAERRKVDTQRPWSVWSDSFSFQ